MKHALFVWVVVFSLSFLATGQASNAKDSSSGRDKTAVNPSSQYPSEPVNLTTAKGFVLEDAVPIRLRFNRTISSADARVNDRVDFEVLQEVSVNGVLVVPKGGLALGTVTEAQPKRRMARGGKLEINVDSVKLADGDKAALRAVQGGKGGGHTGAMTMGIVATGVIFFPAAPLFLFMHGKDITIPKGAEVTAYINGDMKLELAKFQSAPGAPQVVATSGERSSVSTGSAKLQLESNPSGADIEVDGSFVGSTPSDLQVAEGDHSLVISKAGFNRWERKLKSNSGSTVHVRAELEKTGTPQ
jgi:hypothetical protein